MTEYIEREAAYQYLDNEVEWNVNQDRLYALEVISDFPAADVAEVRHAFWSDYGSGVCCTNCGVSLFHQDENNNWGIEPSKFMFCPSCGARMDKEDEHEVG